MRRLTLAAAALGLVAALLAAHGSSVQAQPVAGIALPDPGGPEQLYPGCNHISLTFPDGTASQTVVQAVTPAGTVEAIWRFNASLARFEGYSPAAPQASDLLAVDFLDAVWICVAGTPLPVPTGTSPLPSPSPQQPPPPSPGPTATPVAAPTPGAGASVSPTDALGSFAFALNMTMSLAAGDDFTATMTTGGEFVAPDRVRCVGTASMAGLTDTREVVVIGNEAWINTGDGFYATSADDFEVVDTLSLCPGSPTFWEGFDVGEVVSLLPGEPETVNGVPAKRYRLGDAIETLQWSGFLPPELEGMTISHFDIWLADSGNWLVRLDLDMSFDEEAFGAPVGVPGEESSQELRIVMQVDITNPNSPNIHIEPPLP